MVVNIIPDASRILLGERSDPLLFLTFMVIAGYCGGKTAMVSWLKLPDPMNCPIIFSQVVHGNQANWPFPKFKQENLANKDLHHSSCSPVLLTIRNPHLCRTKN